jgi:hypothetical protein
MPPKVENSSKNIVATGDVGEIAANSGTFEEGDTPRLFDTIPADTGMYTVYTTAGRNATLQIICK